MVFFYNEDLGVPLLTSGRTLRSYSSHVGAGSIAIDTCTFNLLRLYPASYHP